MYFDQSAGQRTSPNRLGVRVVMFERKGLFHNIFSIVLFGAKCAISYFTQLPQSTAICSYPVKWVYVCICTYIYAYICIYGSVRNNYVRVFCFKNGTDYVERQIVLHSRPAAACPPPARRAQPRPAGRLANRLGSDGPYGLPWAPMGP